MIIKKLDIIEDELISGVDAIAFTEAPAIEEDYHAFKKQNFQSYSDYPEAASENACKVLRWIDEHGRDEVSGMTRVGLARANQLCNKEPISLDTISRMAAFIRHESNAEIADEYAGTPWKDKGYVAWLAWGGTEGINWAIRKMNQLKGEMSRVNVDGVPGFTSKEEALAEASNLGCGGYYERIVDGVRYFFPCQDATEFASLDVAGIADYVNDLGYFPGDVDPDLYPNPNIYDVYEEVDPANIDVYGYETRNFEICPGAIGLMNHLKEMETTDDQKEMIRTAAIIADALFRKEKEVIDAEVATHEDVVEALAIAKDFSNLMEYIDSLLGMKHDISWVQGHIDVIKSYLNQPSLDEDSITEFIIRDYMAEVFSREGFSEDFCESIRSNEADVTEERRRAFQQELQEKRMIIGPLMVPNKLIERLDENGDQYYVYFTPDVIKKIAYKFMKDGHLKNFNIEHISEDKVDGVSVVESWLVENPMIDKTNLYGKKYEKGTWVAMVKVDNEEMWNRVKKGEFAGWSVEGYFVDKLLNQKDTFVEPRPGESEDDFMGRCIPKLRGEGKSQDQALGACYGMWKNR